MVIENFKVGGLEPYRLDYASLARGQSRAWSIARITGFGQTGPYAPRAGYDFLIQGMGGLMSDHRPRATASPAPGRRRSAWR